MGHTRIGGDYFLDGSFGSHTAWIKEPFSSPPPEGSPPNGIKYRDDEELFGFFLAAQSADLQVGVHAIGDAAIEQAITTWERVAARVGEPASCNSAIASSTSSAPAMTTSAGRSASGSEPVSSPRSTRSGVETRASMPTASGGRRAREMNRFGTMCERDLPLAAGSDSTVTPLDPFLQMKALRAHHLEGQSISGELALALHTMGGHHAAGQEDKRGAIEPGALADFAWLDRDPVTTDPDELTDTEVLGTWASGVRVWPSSEAETD